MLSLFCFLRDVVSGRSASPLFLESAKENPALQTLKCIDDVTQSQAIDTLESCLQRKIELQFCTNRCDEELPTPSRPLKLYQLAKEKGPDEMSFKDQLALEVPVQLKRVAVQRDSLGEAESFGQERSFLQPILKQNNSPTLRIKQQKKVRIISTEVKPPDSLPAKQLFHTGPLSVPTDFYSSNIEKKRSLHLKYQYEVPKTSCCPLEIKRVYQKLVIIRKLASSFKTAGATFPGPNEHQDIIDHLVCKADFYNQCIKKDLMYLGFMLISQSTVVVLTVCSVITWIRSKRVLFGLRSVFKDAVVKI